MIQIEDLFVKPENQDIDSLKGIMSELCLENYLEEDCSDYYEELKYMNFETDEQIAKAIEFTFENSEHYADEEIRTATGLFMTEIQNMSADLSSSIVENCVEMMYMANKIAKVSNGQREISDRSMYELSKNFFEIRNNLVDAKNLIEECLDKKDAD